MDDLTRRLKLVRRRVRLALATRWALYGLAAGLLLSAGALFWGGKLWPMLWVWPAWGVAGVISVTCAALGGAASLTVRLDDFAVARIVEGHASLKDRVSSAVWAVRGAQSESEALAGDAAASLDQVPLRRTIRIVRWPHVGLPAAAAAVLAVAILLPSISLFQSPEVREERLAVRKQGAHLQKVATRVEQMKTADKELRQQLAAQLSELGKQLESGRLSSEEARVRMSKLEDRLLTKAESLEQRSNLDKLWSVPGNYEKHRNQIAAGVSDLKGQGLAGQTGQTGKMQSQGTSGEPGEGNLPANLPPMQYAGDTSGPGGKNVQLPPDLVKRLAELYGLKDFQDAAKLMEELRRKLGDLSPEQQKQLAQDLEALAKALNEADLEELARQMLEAAKALNEMDPEKAKELLSQACENCKGLGMSMGSCSALRQGAAALSSGGFNQYSSTDEEHKDGRGIGNAPDAPRKPGANRLDKDWTRLYDPRSTERKTRSMKAQSQTGPQGQMRELQVEGAGDRGGSSVPYYEVLPEYEKAAEKALSREDIPVSERKRVRDYFDSLK